MKRMIKNFLKKVWYRILTSFLSLDDVRTMFGTIFVKNGYVNTVFHKNYRDLGRDE